MANTTITCPADSWTLLTDADVTAVRVQNKTTHPVVLMATVGAGTAPSDLDGGIRLAPGQILLADTTIENLWPGVSGANRVWAYAQSFQAQLSVSHA